MATLRGLNPRAPSLDLVMHSLAVYTLGGALGGYTLGIYTRGGRTLGAWSSHRPMLDLVAHLLVVKKSYRGLFKVNVVSGIN